MLLRRIHRFVLEHIATSAPFSEAEVAFSRLRPFARFVHAQPLPLAWLFGREVGGVLLVLALALAPAFVASLRSFCFVHQLLESSSRRRKPLNGLFVEFVVLVRLSELSAASFRHGGRKER